MALSPDYESTSLDSLHQMVTDKPSLTVPPGLYLSSDIGGSAGPIVLDVAGQRTARRRWRGGTVPAKAAFRMIADHRRRFARARLKAADD